MRRAELEERLPRSAPDALRYEPGVYVQQTAHAQASPFVRGLTGQQVVHLFDGVRLNNGVYRQGPNQYFFTVDSQTLAELDVLRGSASVRYGSDALGGAILARPRMPLIDESLRDGVDLHPRAYGRFASADLSYGARAELEGALGSRTAILGGVGFRHAGLLTSGGVVQPLARSTSTDRGSIAPWVPRFREEADHSTDPSKWRTQLGTGFDELTADLRVDHRLARDLTVTAAYYGYYQSNAPRTDQCPAPEAPIDECLTVAAQDRSLGYVALRGDAGPELRDLELIASFQQNHEERVRDRPRSFVRFDYRDDVTTLGLAARGSTRRFALDDDGGADVRVRFGAEIYRDGVRSNGSQSFIDIDRTFALSRGQYLDGSSYVNGGLWLEVDLTPVPFLTLRGGGRVALVGARATADPESGSARIAKEWAAVIGRAGVELRASDEVSFLVNVDQGFRAPNLDDLTSRQQIGPGFQLENAELAPERSLTTEVGVMVGTEALRFDAWGYATSIENGIVRAVRNASDCPPATPECAASRNQLELVNATDLAWILGAEGGVTAYLLQDVALRATMSYAWGEGPNTGARTDDPAFGEPRVPLSRIPPLNGTVEARYRHAETGLYAAAVMRWATDQRRLAPSDRSDARIPTGGTPGYAVFDLRAGWRVMDQLRLSLLFENIFDEAWRSHGSSINGPGRGLLAEVMVGL